MGCDAQCTTTIEQHDVGDHADLFNTSWDMLLTDVNTDEMYKIVINICLEICKKHVLVKLQLPGVNQHILIP